MSTLFVYDPSTDHWVSGASIPTPSACSTSGAVNGKLHLLTPSCTGSGGPFYVYDSTGNGWAQSADAPSTHTSPASGVINGKLYVAGGYDASGKPTNALVAYDPGIGSWSTLAPMPTPRG
jgi:N-acetylneuraminic acid mutarotase